MCDYSLEQVASRAAVKNDRLVTTGFSCTITRGFAGIADRNTAVCLLPGTEVVFDSEPRIERSWWFATRLACRTARFRQVNTHEPRCHHDALEFSDGTVVLLSRLKPDQIATVLQLPKQSAADHRGEARDSESLSTAIATPAEPT